MNKVIRESEKLEIEKRFPEMCDNLPQFSENQIRIDELNRLEVHADLPHLLDYVLKRYEELE